MSNDNAKINGNKDKRFERVILNVGGIKYETYRNTLTAFPETLLGTMFQERNQQILHPIDVENNEYFFDRNGRAFHYIMEFYRTGKPIWEDIFDRKNTHTTNYNNCIHDYVSEKELLIELDYFQIPIRTQIHTPPTLDDAVKVLEEFTEMMKYLIYEVQKLFRSQLIVHLPLFEFNYLSVRPDITSLQSLIAPFRYNGSAITHRYGPIIQNNLIEEFPGLNCTIAHENIGTSNNEVWVYSWRISAPLAFPQNEVIEKSVLKNSGIDLI
ncbi:8315_t:CDS:2 [Ambispora leptoticha]|uniref:8315_t:CDS:1 n=1 Tax=Ambispora leptoticha TaxID=144679 RepID=A0A9N8VD45_9GLOM|nr:8315_t:CDS:2 [Ambispora leptoticha]